LYFKLEDVGEGNRKAKPGDYVTAQISIRTEKDSVLFDTWKMGLDGAVTFILPDCEYEKDYREGFQYLSEGDSAAFITDAYTLFIKKNHSLIPKGMNLESAIRVEAKMLKIRTPEEHEQDVLVEKKKFEQGEFDEKKILDKFLADSSIHATPIANGMYYIILHEGNGITPDSGRVALLNYRGFFLNGRCFDSNYESQPFEYTLGAEEQMIRGLELGVRRMHEGEKAKFIIPSHLAFGSSGSSTGMVPPFTTVIYEVELLKVQ
jgi:FKBP-type peptidyl-prolyl cis-trans isomerase